MSRIDRFYFQALGFVLGIVAALYLPFRVNWILFLAAAAALIAVHRRIRCGPFICLLLGAAWLSFRAGLTLDVELPRAFENRPLSLVGTVSGIPQYTSNYLKFDVEVERIEFRGKHPFRSRVRLHWYDADDSIKTQLTPGSKWRLNVKLKRPHGYYSPGAFDYEAMLFRYGIRARGYVRQGRLMNPGSCGMDCFRQALSRRIAVIVNNTENLGIINALSIGDRSSLSQDAWEVLRETGTNHLVAISGLHIGLAAALGMLIGTAAGRVAGLRFKGLAARDLGILVALLMAVAYAGLAGFNVPTQRALLMLFVTLVAVLSRRRTTRFRPLCIAGLAVVILDPLAVQDPGFWLSFYAVAVLISQITDNKSIGLRAAAEEHATRYPWLRVQLVLTLALSPLVVLFFGRMSLVSIPANLVAVPLVGFALVPLCLASVVCLIVAFPAGAQACLAASEFLVGGLQAYLNILSELSYSSWSPVIPQPMLISMCVGILWWLTAGARRHWAWLALLAWFYPQNDPVGLGEFEVRVLDVGQGLAAVVRTSGHTLLYDTGPRYRSGFNLAETVVLPQLNWLGIRRIDMLMVSHGDNDHIGGLGTVLDRYEVSQVLSSVADRIPAADYCVAGQRWTWDHVAFEVSSPPGASLSPHNNASCVLKISNGRNSFLLTGDIEREAETELVRRVAEGLRAEALLVPHQGSKTSSTHLFLDAVSPRLAIVSSGYLNAYGHPHPEVMERYRARGIETYNTAFDGTVVVRSSRRGFEVKTWRGSRPRIWMQPAGVRD